jgi:hypothetical protein
LLQIPAIIHHRNAKKPTLYDNLKATYKQKDDEPEHSIDYDGSLAGIAAGAISGA